MQIQLLQGQGGIQPSQNVVEEVGQPKMIPRENGKIEGANLREPMDGEVFCFPSQKSLAKHGLSKREELKIGQRGLK